jgi:pyroglutamyl-peptidase
MKTLLTGSNRFGNKEINPSERVVQHFAEKARKTDDADLVAEVLPTEFFESGRKIVELIRKFRPERIICLGLATGARTIRLERVALNLDDGEVPDNAGLAPQGRLIVEEGPRAYWSTLPIEEMKAGLNRRGISAAISNHAGTYVCNHVFYLARHEVELLGTNSACGFIHLPPLSERREGAPHVEGLPLEVMIEAVECCLGF